MKRAVFGSLLVIAAAIIFWLTVGVAIDRSPRPDALPVVFSSAEDGNWQATLHSPPQAWVITGAERESVSSVGGVIKALEGEPVRYLASRDEPGGLTVRARSRSDQAPIASPFVAGNLETLFWLVASALMSVLLGLIGMVLVANGLGLNRLGSGEPRRSDLLSGLTLWLGLGFVGPMIGAWCRRDKADSAAWIPACNFHLSVGIYVIAALLMTTFAIGFLLVSILFVFHVLVVLLRLIKPGRLPFSQVILGRPPRERKR
ncbi:DUF4870 domain-containing protein [Gammaproteobacteria bacterium]|nr:DUF4870 domain-containing protein [Gammaproteobacteria bacterium]